MGRGASRHKSMNAHLHQMEALTTYYRMSQSPLARERLQELIGIETSQIFGAHEDASTNLFEPDWTPVLKRPEACFSYGHDLENIWLVVDACEAASIPVGPHLPLLTRVFDTCMRLGFDHEQGGFFFSGPPGQPADERRKLWWVQAEAMVAALTMYRLTSEPSYFEVFEKTWRFVDEHIIDWQYGEWYYCIAADGTPVDYKANEWKDGYHNGRAVLECLRLLRQFRPASA
jgi:mannobiose 2-epimerase